MVDEFNHLRVGQRAAPAIRDAVGDELWSNSGRSQEQSDYPAPSLPLGDFRDTGLRQCSGMTNEGDGGLVSEASQEPQLAFEGGRGVRAAGERNHERCGDPGGVDRERLIEEVLIAVSICGGGDPGFRI
jgi:hypothetical protein